jgi:hypothetical protein
MTVTANMILTFGGSNLPLDQRRKDALAHYARMAAKRADARSAQGWVERTWDLKPYEAKDLLKGNSSEAIWERIVKHKNGGWPVVLPVIGAVIGHDFDQFLDNLHRRKALEREQIAAEERRAAAMASDMRSLFTVVVGGSRELSRAPDWPTGEQPDAVDDSTDQDSTRKVNAHPPFLMRREP